MEGGGRKKVKQYTTELQGIGFRLRSARRTRSPISQPQKWRGAREGEKVHERAPGSRFSLTFWRLTRSPITQPQKWRGAQEGEKVHERAPGSRFSLTFWLHSEPDFPAPKIEEGRDPCAGTHGMGVYELAAMREGHYILLREVKDAKPLGVK